MMRPKTRAATQSLCDFARALLVSSSLAASVTIFVAGCNGSVGGSPQQTGAGGTGMTGSSTGTAGTGTGTGGSGTVTGTAGTGTVTGAGGNVAACPTTMITPTPLRRLTKFEYANTARDLLNVDVTPVADLPADEVSEIFDNNAGVLTVSSLHAEKYVLVSEALAKAAVAKLSSLTNCDPVAKGEATCATEFAKSFGRRAFRRPTTAQDEQLLMSAYTAGRDGGSFAEGIEVMIRAALQSSNFLYRLELTAPSNANAAMVPLSQFELASRLSFLFWGSGPDNALLDSAARGELSSKAAVQTRAKTMLADPKARVAITKFFNQWTGTTRLDLMTKSTALFPSYSETLRAAMQAETSAFVQYTMWTGDHKLSTFLTAPIGFVSGPLATLYGVMAPSGATPAAPGMVNLPAAQGRSGILTQAGFLAVQAHPDQTSPVLRGKFVRTAMLCQPIAMPPPDVDISLPDNSSGKTARERFSAHETAANSCASCHVMMDPIGLAFETFDAVGQYRTTENGVTIDVSGAVNVTNDPALMGNFTGVRELGAKLAASKQVQDCVATQWFRYAAGRDEETPDGCSLTSLRDAFTKSGGDLAEMAVALTQTDAFWYRAPIKL